MSVTDLSPRSTEAADAPLVSVIMNCLNCEAYLAEAIDSVYAQTFSNWEIILWDNASSDKSAEIAKRYDARLKYFRGEETIPLGAARNRAIEQARGTYIAFLDCDDLWLPSRLERQVAILQRTPDVDLVHANYFELDSRRGDLKRLAHSTREPEGRIFGLLLSKYTIGLLTVLVRRSALERLGVQFDNRLNLLEEVDVFLRVLYTSQAAYVDAPVAVYRIHGQMSSLARKDEWFDEWTYLIGKLRVIDIGGHFDKELQNLEKSISLIPPKLHLVRGELKAARKMLAPKKWFGPQFLLLFILTFVPSGVWKLAKPIWRKYAPFLAEP